MYLKALKYGICSQFVKDYIIVRQAVINLGGEEFVELKNCPSWWIKDYWELPRWKQIYTRIRILIRVGGLNSLEREISRIEQRLDGLPIFLDNLTPDKSIYTQLRIRHDIPVTMRQLRKILLSMGCPHIYDTHSDIRGREEVIQFIRVNWHTLRIRLCI